MPVDLRSLGYIGFGGQDLEAWGRCSRRLLGAESVPRALAGGGQALGLRLDDRCHRLVLSDRPDDPRAWFGFELPDGAALGRAQDALRERGLAVTDATADELALRRVEAMAWLRDPDGNRLELYCGLAAAATPFRPDRPMGGFRTGDLGVGHVVFVVENLERARDFYADVLGFRVSDYVLTPNRRVFMRINGRHHTVALAERPGGGVAHIMIEVQAFDDLGRAYDVALGEYPDAIYSTLGRHSNDHMTSFYVQTPAGVPIEYGWGGRIVDERSWQVESLFGPSLWGHDRVGATPAARAAADAQREIAFRAGLRAPLSFES